MDESNAKKRMYVYFIVMAIFFIGLNILFRLVENMSIKLWISIPVVIIFLIVGWKIMAPIRTEMKKGGESKKELETSLSSTCSNISSVFSYIFATIFLLFGLFFLGIVLLANFYVKNMSSSETLIFSGISLALLIVGVGVLFLGRWLSKRKK